jgi:hypothetical protein
MSLDIAIEIRRGDEQAVREALARRDGMSMTELVARAHAVRFGCVQPHLGRFDEVQRHRYRIRDALARLEREGDVYTAKAPKGGWTVYHLRKEVMP